MTCVDFCLVSSVKLTPHLENNIVCGVLSCLVVHLPKPSAPLHYLCLEHIGRWGD